MFDVSCWNWTGPKIDPKTKKLFRLETNELAEAMTKRQAVNDQLVFGKDEIDEYMEFIAESGLADTGTTANTTYPRSELRQTLPNGDDKEANWQPKKKPQSLKAKLRIMQLAKSLKAIIGQIHGDSDHPPLKIQVTGDTVYAQLRRELNGEEDKPVLGKFKIGEVFTYRVDVFEDYTVDIYFNNKLIIEKYQFDAESYAKDTWYWKAGMYSQEKAKGGKGCGRVRFYEITVTDGKASIKPVDKPTERTIATLSNEVGQMLTDFQAGDRSADAALAAIQVLKTEADTQFPKSNERSALYTKIDAARKSIRAQPQTAPTPTPAPEPTPEPDKPTNTGEAIKTKLSDMEDVLDDLPDAQAEKLRELINDVRKLV